MCKSDPLTAYGVTDGQRDERRFRVAVVYERPDSVNPACAVVYAPEQAQEEPDPLPEPEPRPFMTPPEAAEVLEVHDETVRRWCVDGTLPAQKYGGVWAIPERDVWRLRGERIGAALRGPGMRAVLVED